MKNQTNAFKYKSGESSADKSAIGAGTATGAAAAGSMAAAYISFMKTVLFYPFRKR